MKCPKCGSEMTPLGDGLLFDNFGREIACYCPEHQTYKIRSHEEKLKDGENCDHEFVNSDGGFKGICKKCGKFKDGEKR